MTKLTRREKKIYTLSRDLGYWFDYFLDNEDLHNEYLRIKKKVEQIRKERLEKKLKGQ